MLPAAGLAKRKGHSFVRAFISAFLLCPLVGLDLSATGGVAREVHPVIVLGVARRNPCDLQYQMVMNTDWMSPVEQGYIIAQQYNTTSETVYVRKGGPKYELTNERKDQLYEYYRLIFPEYYLQLVGTKEWQNADNEKRLEMLSKVRSSVGGIAKAWLAEQLQDAGAPVYTGK